MPFDDVVAGLAAVVPAAGRMDVQRTPAGALLIDDAYNANPASMAAALRALERVGAAGRTIAVVGDMLELGDATGAEHARVGELAAAVEVDVLVAVGDAMTSAADAARAVSLAVPLVLEVPDAGIGARRGTRPRRPCRRRRVGQGQPRGRPRAGGRRAGAERGVVIALLVAAGIAFMLSILGTPLLIRILKRKGIGQQIRDDGPIEHPHAAKAGTPTMGGIAIVGRACSCLPRRARPHRADQVRDRPDPALGLIVAMGVLGFIDDYLGIRKARNLGLRKRGKTLGIMIIAAAFGVARARLRAHLDAPVVHPHLDFDLGSLVVVRSGDRWSSTPPPTR